jgi:sec-independent protein translocase protein TatB
MELLGVSLSEFFVLVILVVLVAGPKGAAQALALVRRGLASFKSWNARLRQESNLSTVMADLNIPSEGLDLRQYDPRRLVRDTVREEMEAWLKQTDSVGRDSGAPAASGGAASTAASLPGPAATSAERTPETNGLAGVVGLTPAMGQALARGAADGAEPTDPTEAESVIGATVAARAKGGMSQ